MPTQQQEEDIIEMYDGGVSVGSIAGELNLSDQTVRNVLKAAGRETNKRKDPERDKAVIKAYEDGIAVQEILRTHKITYTQLYYLLNVNEVPIRKKTEEAGRNAALDVAVQMYIDGSALWRIKEDTGVAQPLLHAELHRREIQLRRPRRMK